MSVFPQKFTSSLKYNADNFSIIIIKYLVSSSVLVYYINYHFNAILST